MPLPFNQVANAVSTDQINRPELAGRFANVTGANLENHVPTQGPQGPQNTM